MGDAVQSLDRLRIHCIRSTKYTSNELLPSWFCPVARLRPRPPDTPNPGDLYAATPILRTHHHRLAAWRRAGGEAGEHSVGTSCRIALREWLLGEEEF